MFLFYFIFIYFYLFLFIFIYFYLFLFIFHTILSYPLAFLFVESLWIKLFCLLVAYINNNGF